MRTLKDLNFKNQRAIIRVDFNVPLNDKMDVTDTTRIEASKHTICLLYKSDAADE